MRTFEVRWKNFRGLSDSGWLRFRPITVILGGNASGKTSVIGPLLVLKQTHEAQDPSLSLKTLGRQFNAGTFPEMVFRHETGRDIVFSIRFRFPKESELKKKGRIGEAPPKTLELTYGYDRRDGEAILTKYKIQDIHGRTMLQRTLLKTGDYALRGIGSDIRTGNIARAIKKSRPRGFLFTPHEVFSAYTDVVTTQLKQAVSRKGPIKRLKVDVNKAVQLYISALGDTAQYVTEILQRIAYVGPLRARPRRIYELSGEAPYSVGPGGEYAPEIIYRTKDPAFLREINRWVSKFEFGLRLEKTPLATGVFSLTLRRRKHSASVNYADTGFGLSQVLPLIVQGLYSKKGGLIIAEQPEIHLNPKLQSALADLFSYIASRDVSVLVETHSEHLLLRMRRLVAEGKVKHKDVGIYFCERHGDMCTIREISIDDIGHIASEEWPKGFFEDTLRESLALAAAQTRSEKATNRTRP